VVLPTFVADTEKPFVMVFWARDPDNSQHNQADNINRETRRFDARSS